jgi:uncharacterized protein (PEP-CTERM system associated)
LRREQLVLDFMRANGIDPNQQAVAGFLTENVQLERLDNLSFAWIGRRGTFTANAAQSRTSQLARFLVGEEFDNSTYVRQRGLSVGYSHRLTPRATLGLLVSQLRTTGDETSISTHEDRAELRWTTLLNERTSLGVTARRVDFDSDTNRYTENALEASLSLRF